MIAWITVTKMFDKREKIEIHWGLLIHVHTATTKFCMDHHIFHITDIFSLNPNQTNEKKNDKKEINTQSKQIERMIISRLFPRSLNVMRRYNSGKLHYELNNIDGLVQDCSNSSALAMELLQSCTKPSIYIDGLIQKRRNSSAFSMELRLYSITFEATIISMCWGDIWHWAIGGHKSVMKRIGNSWTSENYVTVATQNIHLSQIVNPLRAKFFRGNINIYLHFVSFLHIDLTQVLKILPQVREGPTYSI